MIKHICIFDRCGKEENLKVKHCVGQDSEQPVIYNLPDRWEYFGVCPKYIFCSECSSQLRQEIEMHIYRFANGITMAEAKD